MFPRRTAYLHKLAEERDDFAAEVAHLTESERVERARIESEEREEPSDAP